MLLWIAQRCHANMVDMAPRDTLATLVKTRRLELGYSTTFAADRAGISRGTWVSLESGARQLAERHHAGVERALQWSPGSVDSVLAGGREPTVAVDVPKPPSVDLLTEAERIGGLPLPAEDRLDMVLILIRAHARAAKASDSRSGKRPA